MGSWIAPQSPPHGAAHPADLRAELADLIPFLVVEDGLTPEHAQELRARVAELVARIGDDR